jgi:hypothetical protein
MGNAARSRHHLENALLRLLDCASRAGATVNGRASQASR